MKFSSFVQYCAAALLHYDTAKMFTGVCVFASLIVLVCVELGSMALKQSKLFINIRSGQPYQIWQFEDTVISILTIL